MPFHEGQNEFSCFEECFLNELKHARNGYKRPEEFHSSPVILTALKKRRRRRVIPPNHVTALYAWIERPGWGGGGEGERGVAGND